MIKLQDLIKEYRGSNTKIDINPIDINIANNLLKTEYTSAVDKFNEKIIIYRGSNYASNNIYLYKPSSFERPSKNTNNFYTALLSVLPSWKNYPRRSRSVICSTGLSQARSYGDVFYIFVKNNAKIGICSQDDFWFSFPYLEKRLGINSLDDLNREFVELFDKAYYFMNPKVNKPNITIDNLDEGNILQYLKQLNSVITIDFVKSLLDRNAYIQPSILVDITKNFNGDWMEYFDKLYNPESNQFKLTTIEQFVYPGKVEVWTDSNVLMLTKDLYDKTF